MEYWQKDIETMGRDQLQELQLTRLKETVKHAANSPFYKEVFEKNGITPDSIQTLDDLRKIPFTTKNDLRSHYPFGHTYSKVCSYPFFKWYDRKPDSSASLSQGFGSMGKPGSSLYVYGRTTGY